MRDNYDDDEDEQEVPQLVIPKYKLLYEDPEVKLKAYEEEGENPEEEKEPEEEKKEEGEEGEEQKEEKKKPIERIVTYIAEIMQGATEQKPITDKELLIIILKAVFNTIKPIIIEPIISAYPNICTLLLNCKIIVIIKTPIVEYKSALDSSTDVIRAVLLISSPTLCILIIASNLRTNVITNRNKTLNGGISLLPVKPLIIINIPRASKRNPTNKLVKYSTFPNPNG